jgi:hypothetical protein
MRLRTFLLPLLDFHAGTFLLLNHRYTPGPKTCFELGNCGVCEGRAAASWVDVGLGIRAPRQGSNHAYVRRTEVEPSEEDGCELSPEPPIPLWDLGLPRLSQHPFIVGVGVGVRGWVRGRVHAGVRDRADGAMESDRLSERSRTLSSLSVSVPSPSFPRRMLFCSPNFSQTVSLTHAPTLTHSRTHAHSRRSRRSSR